MHNPKGPVDESKYYEARNVVVKADGISEESQVLIMLRIFISHMTRLWMVSPGTWKELASIALAHMQSKWPILVGGFVGRAMGDFNALLLVYI